jgi:hypothetical protein
VRNEKEWRVKKSEESEWDIEKTVEANQTKKNVWKKCIDRVIFSWKW